MNLTDYKEGRPTSYEVFQTEQRDGTHEYGYRFKDADDDTLFEIVLGDEYLWGSASEGADERMDASWAKYEWLAKALVAAPEQPNTEN